MKGIALVLGLASLALSSFASGQPPNVILIMADDMGYSDIGSFGGEIDTPNLDRIAATGIRYSQFYNTARCSPTRASLLTGRYPHKVQMGHLAGKRFAAIDGYRGHLATDINTLPEVLAAGGYRNHMVGKWHLANHAPQDLTEQTIATLSNTPLKRGFHTFYGTLLGGNNYFSPKYLYRNNTATSAVDADYYYTDAISHEAVAAVRHHVANRSDVPFFLYVAYTAPHWPIQAPRKTIEKYRTRYQSGWQRIRRQRFQKMRAQGVVSPGWALGDFEEPLPNWADVPNKAWQIERMAVHAAMVEHMDRGVGVLVAAVQEAKALNNTMVIFLSDNGASAEDFPAKIPREMMARLGPVIGKYAPASGEALVPGNSSETMPGGKTTLQSIGPLWAQVSNTPFRKYKSWVHEGGIATPLLVRWPKGVSLAPGSIVHEPGHVVDLMPTILAAAGVGSSVANHKSMDGVSLLPSLRGKKSKRRSIYFEHQGNRAVRKGRWKLVGSESGDWELYDMERDRTETTDLAMELPKRVKTMSKAFDTYASRSKVLPWSEVAKPNGPAL